jgi:hypothetical protein
VVGLVGSLPAFHATNKAEDDAGATAVTPPNFGAVAAASAVPASRRVDEMASKDASSARTTQSLPVCIVPAPHSSPCPEDEEHPSHEKEPATRRIAGSLE